MLSPFRETLGAPVNSSVLREEAAPLRLEQVDDVEVLGLGLGVASLCGQEMDVGVSREPALPVHVGPPLQSQSELALAGLDAHLCPDRLVLEASGDVDYDVASRQPSLACAIDVGVGDLAKPHVAAHVEVPTAEV